MPAPPMLMMAGNGLLPEGFLTAVLISMLALLTVTITSNVPPYREAPTLSGSGGKSPSLLFHVPQDPGCAARSVILGGDYGTVVKGKGAGQRGFVDGWCSGPGIAAVDLPREDGLGGQAQCRAGEQEDYRT